MHKIIVTSGKFDGHLEFQMDDQGVVKQFINNASMDVQQIEFLGKNFPISLERLKQVMEVSSSMTVKFIQTDLSFKYFWTTYAYKVGNKSKCEKLWNTMSDVDKSLALEMIPVYNTWLKKKQVAKVYPERYLSQRRYENEFAS